MAVREKGEAAHLAGEAGVVEEWREKLQGVEEEWKSRVQAAEAGRVAAEEELRGRH